MDNNSEKNSVHRKKWIDSASTKVDMRNMCISRWVLPHFTIAFHNQWVFFFLHTIVVWLYPFVNRSLVILWFHASCSVNDRLFYLVLSVALLLSVLSFLSLYFVHFFSHFFSLVRFPFRLFLFHTHNLNFVCTQKSAYIRVNRELWKKSKNMKGWLKTFRFC